MKKNFKNHPKEDIGIAKSKLPHEVRVFLDHLECGLDCFDEDFLDYQPYTMTHNEHGVGLLFSQLSKNKFKQSDMADSSLIVSRKGIHLKKEKILFFTNEQPPTKLALLVLSAMIMQEPLDFDWLHCD
tara:strand:+ start:195 stop:578 length:384 start_codon:yes stop_codon:yes gene_type:complete